MKFSLEVDINKPIDEVLDVWKNEDLLIKWQDDFISKTLISGNPYQKEAVSVFKYSFGNKVMELEEIVLTSNLPTEFKALYVHEHMDNYQTTRFVKVNDHLTKYITEIDYFKFKKWLPKMLFKLFPKMFKNKSLKWMNQFKALVEGS